MVICRLFHRDRPFEQVEARVLSEGVTTIGRDPGANWVLADDTGALSRIHCALRFDGERVRVTDCSANGVFLDSGERVPKDQPIEIPARRGFRLGDFSILVEEAEAPAAEGATPRANAPPPRPRRDGSLLEAFCEGAKLDVSAFSGEDPEELMRRLGAIYQQTVVGLAALMAERAKMKAQYDLERTTIGAADNNPFKWSDPRRLAQDLLTSDGQGFLGDAAAVRASYEDLTRHLSAISQATNLAADRDLQALSPQVIEAQARQQGGLLRSKAAVCWDLYVERYGQLTAEQEGAGLVGHAFGRAYGEASSQ